MNRDFYNRDEERSGLLEGSDKYTSKPFELNDKMERTVPSHARTSSWSGPVKRIIVVTSLTVLLLVAYNSLPSAKQKLISEMPSPSLDNVKTGKSSYPNIVFILTDDVGWNAFGTYDDLGFATPNINKLVSSGISIENYYTQEICTPGRASLMTGRYPSSNGMQYGEISGYSTHVVPISETFLPEVLKTAGYTNYALGKWNLGHKSAQYLPTARGFDHFLGYLDGGNYYWSKRDSMLTSYTDFSYATAECYESYSEDDLTTYSTTLYSSKALDVINSHKYDEGPMFLYMAYTAAHEPFDDTDYADGVTADLVGNTRYDLATEKVVGVERMQVALAMMLLDDGVQEIVNALDHVSQLDNTYIVITSDNGGCYMAGGKNGPLRGSKGSLFEGGTKVDAYIFSPLLPSSAKGSTYKGLFHVSDWFPTLLGFAGIAYTPTEGHELDGIDHSTSLVSSSVNTVAFPRSSLLYGMYLNVSGKTWDMNTSAPVAIRDNRYKLLHAYSGNAQSLTYYPYDLVEDDDILTDAQACGPDSAMKGTYEKFLFDLVKDPYETTNLYNDSSYADVKSALYQLLDDIQVVEQAASYQCDDSSDAPNVCTSVWENNGNYIQPWNDTIVQRSSFATYPSYCTPTDSVFMSRRRLRSGI